ncbi:MAG: bifunctional DNA-formamidopyrimidine glycosylase/DNA-(apurinic or apyrimidinic site) lyase [Myxococcota bacterium]
MPELPEVEITRRNLERWLTGRRIERAKAAPSRVFRGADVKAFRALGGRLLAADRRGKYLLLTFEGGRGLLSHLGMTGKYVRRPPGHLEPHSRARFILDTGEVIHYRDPRMFGRMQPAPAEKLPALVAHLGRDPFLEGLTAAQLTEALAGSKQAIKVALMDQERLAGLGNIHAAEALFRARLDPRRKPNSLTAEEWKRLAKAIRDDLRFAIDEEASDEIEYVEEPGAPNPFLIYGRAGEPCPRCGTTVRALTQAGRTTHYCPQCQR